MRGDTVGRVSGDEFGVVLTDLAQADDAAFVAQKILDALGRPFDLGGNEAYVTASIGISVFPADGSDAETCSRTPTWRCTAKELAQRLLLLHRRDEPALGGEAAAQHGSRRAVERGEFVLHYQPKVDLRDGRTA